MKKCHIIFTAAILGLILSGTTRAEEVPAAKIKAAIKKSLPLLEKSAVTYTEKRSCFSCHHQAMPVLALAEAKKRGWQIGEKNLQKVLDFTADFLRRGEKNYRKGRGQGGRVTTAGYALLTLETGGRKPNKLTEAVTGFLLKADNKLNHWRTSARRPPSEASQFTPTYLALRGLQVFGTKEQKKRIAERKKKILPWVIKTKPRDTEDRVFRLWALRALQADKKLLQKATKELLQLQRDDGGWAQTKDLNSDAYATGSVLVVLHQAGGIAAGQPAYQRGLKLLIKQQLDDGSWHVKSRSRPFQTYFESGFPHGKDQFISIAASSWATLALLQDDRVVERSVLLGR